MGLFLSLYSFPLIYVPVFVPVSWCFVLFCFYKFILFIYFWLCWVSAAAHGLSLAAASRGPLFAVVWGLLIVVASLCCGVCAPGMRASVVVAHTGPVAPRHVGSSQTRAQTRIPCTGRQTPNHCATREALSWCFDYCSFVAKSEVRECETSSFVLFSQDYFGNFGSLWFHTNLRVICSSSVKNVMSILIGKEIFFSFICLVVAKIIVNIQYW